MMRMKKLVSIFLPLFVFIIGMSGVNAATIKVNKVEVGTNTAISGATMTLSKPKPGSAGGDIIEEWTTNGSVKEITIEPGTYLLRENYPAPGYLNATDKEIVITDVDQVYNVTSESDYTKAEFGATDSKTGKFITGVDFQLLKSDGSVYASWTSTTERHRIDRIPLGTYKLKVVSVPEGYHLAEEVSVVINELCKDVKLFKVDLPSEEVIPTPTPTPDSEEETIENVPDTGVSDSNMLYGLGLIVIAMGSGIAYKYAKQN